MLLGCILKERKKELRLEIQICVRTGNSGRSHDGGDDGVSSVARDPSGDATLGRTTGDHFSIASSYEPPWSIKTLLYVTVDICVV